MSEEHIEGMDNTTALSRIIETGDEQEVKLLLGDRSRIRPAGIIRPGIKTPVSTCTQAQKDLYQKMLDEGQGFDAIDQAMLKLEKQGSTRKSCLRPSNCDHFIVRDEDFANVRDAQHIRSHYADEDGKIRVIPIWLSTSDLATVAGHSFRAFDGYGNLRCVSFYNEAGKLQFRYISKDTNLPAKETDWKILDSDDEDEATKKCGYQVQFGAMYRVYVPGQRSAGEIVVPSRSWNGVAESIGVLKRVRAILGRFDGLFQGNPFLELVKTQVEIRHGGKSVKQFIASIQLAVDPMELAKHAEQTLTRGARAISLFNAAAPQTPPAASIPSASCAPAPTTTQGLGKSAQSPAVAMGITDTEPSEVEKAHAAIAKLCAWAKFTETEVDACYLCYGGKSKEATTTAPELRYLFTTLKSALYDKENGGPDKVKAHLQKYLGEHGETEPIDPEVEAMIQEIINLAEHNDLNSDHVLAHLVAISGGLMPEDHTIDDLRRAYEEIAARIETDKEIFKEEIMMDYSMVSGEEGGG
jgi:hypothetical protein